MNPWISTSLPLYELIAWVTPKFALIESTSRAKVSRGTSLPCATRPRNPSAAQKLTAKRARDRCRARRELSQRGKVLLDLSAVCEHRGKHPSKYTQEDDAPQNEGLERAEDRRIRDLNAPRGEHSRADVGHDMPSGEAGHAAGDRERGGLGEDDAQDRPPSRAQRTHGGDLAPAREGGAVHRHEHVEQRSEERRVGKECRSRWSPYH